LESPAHRPAARPWLGSKWLLLVPLLLLGVLWLALVEHSPQASEVTGFRQLQGYGQRVAWLHALVGHGQAPLAVLFERLLASLELGAPRLLRMTSLLLAAGSLLALYALGQRLLSRGIALLACLLLALSPVLLWYSSEASSALLPMLLSLIAVVSFYRVGEARGGLGAWAVLGLVLVALVLSHSHGLGFVLGLSLLARMLRLSREGRIHAAVALAGALWLFYRIRVLGYVLPVASESHGELLQLGWLAPLDLRSLWLDWLASGRSFAPAIDPLGDAPGRGLLAWLRIGFELLTALLLWRGMMTLVRSQHLEREFDAGSAQRRPASLQLLYFVLLWPACALMGSLFGAPATWPPAHWLVLLPFFLLLIAAGLGTRGGGNKSLSVAMVLFVLLQFDLLGSFRAGEAWEEAWGVDEPAAAWEQLADYVAEDLAQGSQAEELYLADSDGGVLGCLEPRWRYSDWRIQLLGWSKECERAQGMPLGGAALLESLDALEVHLEDGWEVRQLALLPLEHNPLRSLGASRAEQRPFYLVFKRYAGQPSPGQHPLLRAPILRAADWPGLPPVDPTLETPSESPGLLRVVDYQSFPSLYVYKLDWIS